MSELDKIITAHNTVDMTGLRLGRWTVKNKSHSSKGRLFWVCQCDCGTIKSVRGANLRDGTSRSCGCLRLELYKCKGRNRSGENHPMWRGGRTKLRSGYIWIKASGHPLANSLGYVCEHRLVKEKELGRYLHADETVHHKNGVRGDNRPDNLELWSSRHPSGQRADDLVKWAKEVLFRYAPNTLISETTNEHK